MQKIEDQFNKDLDFDKIFTQRMPDFEKLKGNVRININ